MGDEENIEVDTKKDTETKGGIRRFTHCWWQNSDTVLLLSTAYIQANSDITSGLISYPVISILVISLLDLVISLPG